MDAETVETVPYVETGEGASVRMEAGGMETGGMETVDCGDVRVCFRFLFMVFTHQCAVFLCFFVCSGWGRV
jgi:hypothetical protein